MSLTDRLLTGAVVMFLTLVTTTMVNLLDVDHTWAVLFTVAAATCIGMLVARRWLAQAERAFIHGYHAGFHEAATGPPCTFRGTSPYCDVYDLAENRARRLLRSS